MHDAETLSDNHAASLNNAVSKMFRNFPTSKERKQSNRWLIAVAGVVMQLALGAVYAWSVFRIPLITAYGWSIAQVMLTFELAILMLGLTAFAGGLWMRWVGSRRVAIIGGVGYGLGTILAGQAGSGPLMCVSYGILGGIGLGLGYIVPLATLIKWFPDRRGMITGLAVAGLGGGALVTAPVAEYLVKSDGMVSTCVILGTIYLVAVVGAAIFMKDPPEGYRPRGGLHRRRNNRRTQRRTTLSARRCGAGSGTRCGQSCS